MKSTCSNPPSVLYRRYRTGRPLLRKLCCSSFLFLLMSVLASIVNKQAHACFEPSQQMQQAALLSNSTIHASSTTELEMACQDASKLSLPNSQLSETGDDYHLAVYLPGVPSKQLQVQVDPDTRMVKVLARTENLAGDEEEGCYKGQWHVDESVHLPDLVMAYRNSVLQLSISKGSTHHSSTEFQRQKMEREEEEKPTSTIPHQYRRPSSSTSSSSAGPFIKGAPRRPRVRGVFPAMNTKTSDTISVVESTSKLPPDNSNVRTTDRTDPDHVHSIRGGGGGGSSEEHAVVVVKQPFHGLLYRVSFDTTESLGKESPGVKASAKDEGAQNRQSAYTHVSRVSSDEMDYWLHKM